MSSKKVVASAERVDDGADAGNDVVVEGVVVGVEEEWPALSSIGSSGKKTVLVSGDATGEAAGDAAGDTSADAQGVGKRSSSSLAEPGGDGADTDAGGEGSDMRAAWLRFEIVVTGAGTAFVLLEFEFLDVPDVPIRFIDLPTTGVAVEAEMVAVVAMMDRYQGGG